jgi:ABC-type transport system substrate-binding protein
MGLNTQTYPFERLDARRAVAYALDRNALNRAAAQVLEKFGGGATVAEESVVTCQILPLNTPGYAPYCPHMRPDSDVIGQWAGPDLSKARELVVRSGTEGAPVSVGMSPCMGPIAKVVVKTLRDLE